MIVTEVTEASTRPNPHPIWQGSLEGIVCAEVVLHHSDRCNSLWIEIKRKDYLAVLECVL
jgi:hypothetical protein